METANSDTDRRPLAGRKEVAEYLGIPAQTVAIWAMKGLGPTYRLIGRHARYDWRDVDSWLAAQAKFGGAAA